MNEVSDTKQRNFKVHDAPDAVTTGVLTAKNRDHQNTKGAISDKSSQQLNICSRTSNRLKRVRSVDKFENADQPFKCSKIAKIECTKTIDEHSKEKCEQIPSSVAEKKMEKYHGEILISDDDVEDQHKIKPGYWIQKYGLTFEFW